MKKLLLTLLIGFGLISCNKDDKGESTAIVVPNPQQLSQIVPADNKTGKSDVNFTTTGAWSSQISEVAGVKSTRADGDWISITPAGGDKAGSYTIRIELLTNYTGEKRSAEIIIKSGLESVKIIVSQEALTANGEKPKPEPSGAGVLKNETTGKEAKLINVKHNIEGPEQVFVSFLSEGKKGEAGEKDEPGFEYSARFFNPLQNGKLKSGIYRIKGNGGVNGEAVWMKSNLAGYGESGTIQVDLNGETYSFTFNFFAGNGTGTPDKLTGSFTGVPEYLNEEIKVASIALDVNQKTLAMRESFSLSASILPENATNKKYTWTSSNPAIATVNEGGYVESVSAGTTTITVTSAEGSKTATCAVTVNPAIAVTGITVTPAEVTILEGEYLTFYLEEKVTISPQNATNKKTTWVSSNESIAVYTGKGVEAHAPGEATITFTTEDGGKTATLKVMVTERESFGNGSIKTTDASGKVLSEYAIYNVNRTIVTRDEVRLEFMNRQNSKVSELTFFHLVENGELKPGTYTVLDHLSNLTGTARYGYVKSAMWGKPAQSGGTYLYFYKYGTVTVAKSGDTYSITFNHVKTNSTVGFESETIACSYNGKFIPTNEYIAVNTVTLNKTTLSLTIGEGAQLQATVNPNNAFDKTLTWSTSNENVASVSDNGSVYTQGVGTAIITVTTCDGAKTATCEVTVKALPETGNGIFSNNKSQSISIKRAEQWINGKEPKEIDIRFAKANSAYGDLNFTLIRAAGDTGALKAGVYTQIRNLMCDNLSVKQSYEGNTGSVTISLSGENYTVTLDLTANDGTKITGTYTGKIPGA